LHFFAQKKAIAHFQFQVQKSAILKFALFCTFSHICSFQKSNCAITLFALFQRATKSVIAHLHIFKERQNVRSHICTFLKSKKSSIAHSHIFKEQQNVQLHIRTFSMSKNVQCGNVGICKCAITQPWVKET